MYGLGIVFEGLGLRTGSSSGPFFFFFLGGGGIVVEGFGV